MTSERTSQQQKVSFTISSPPRLLRFAVFNTNQHGRPRVTTLFQFTSPAGSQSNTNKDTRGTAFVVYEDIYDAKAAVDHLSGFNVGGRYLVVLYYQPAKFQKRAETEEKQKELELLRSKVNAKKAQMESSNSK
ncbi:RNA recognition motif containing protein [Nitzschia inconspicua]|uniref:RNA recognition motif containing protein n=1 Tax=Nitzschia inconspicua TaxID=303405 RepID=A0A9K3LZQ6_9STRA|nr:RNA recognition motif containing protein [Nitzschia inconspicua]